MQHRDQSIAADVLNITPISLPRAGRVGGAQRAAQIAALTASHLAPVAARSLLRRDPQVARAVRRIFERLGATYVKFGQFVASAPGVVGEGVAEEFRTCLDTGPPVPFSRIRASVERALGRPLQDVFVTFDERPLAAASVAVVHRATLSDGTPVAVKVLRPGIEGVIATDLGMIEWLARFMASRGIDQMYNVVGLLVGLRGQIAEELDLRNEARTMDVFRGLYERYALARLVVPRVHHEWTSRRVLTMELLDGAPIDDLAHARSLGVDPAPLVRELLKAWVLTALRVGAFHADIHAGNLLVLRDGRLGVIDWGIVARMDADSRRMFRRLCEASLGIEEAWDDIAALMIEMNGAGLRAIGLSDLQIRRFTRALFEPVLTLPLQEVSMAAMMNGEDPVVRTATGKATPRPSLRDRLRVMRIQARVYRGAAADGTFERPLMRMGLLSMKQLLYLERYGRLYIPDERLLGDGTFIRQALSGLPEIACS